MDVYGGLDEVGTGALAGPAIAVCVKMPLAKGEWPLPEVKDSKLTTAIQRESIDKRLVQFIEQHRGGMIGVGVATVEMINEMGHQAALQAAYRQATKAVCAEGYPALLVVDGSVGVDGYPRPQRVEPKADVNYFTVAAASIIAKLYRDDLMDEMHLQYPQYGWNTSKGYGTFAHLDALLAYGPCPLHREKAVRTALKKQQRQRDVFRR